MNINRSNYEIWLIDWLDGNLSTLHAEQLELFLSKNPDLKKEFEDISTINLKPSENSYHGKSLLKKTTSELTGSQFEYLCIASLENDISASQKAELREIVEQDPERKQDFEIIQKLKLVPEEIRYPYKNRLIRRPLAQRVIKLSVIGLSAAAAIALIIMTYLIIPRNLDYKSKDGIFQASSNTGKNGTFSVSTQNTTTDSSLKTSKTNIPEKKLADKNPVGPKQYLGSMLALSQKKNSEIPNSGSVSTIPGDSTLRNPSNTGLQIEKIPVPDFIDHNDFIINNRLVASNFPDLIPDNDGEGRNVGRFIAKNFREIFLKEKSPKDSPLKGYEIAEAGVTGLNKLFGWEMALSSINDKNGELRSVYFSSKLLKFNAPVKKTEPGK